MSRLTPLASQAVVLALALITPAAITAQSAPRSARPDSATIATACADIRSFFTRSDELFQQAARSATEGALRTYADATFADDPALHVAGSSGFTFRSKTEFLRLAMGAGYQADTTFVVQTRHASVAIVSPTRALYVRRFVELDAEYFARGQTRPYLAWNPERLRARPMAGAFSRE